MFHAIVFLPLLGSIIAGFFGHAIGKRGAQLITSSFLVISALLSMVAFYNIALGHGVVHVEVLPWIKSGDFELSWAFKVDTLTAVMLVVVTGVSSLVHIYSIGYMSHDPHVQRFMAYLSLFTFAMLMLVTADNFIQMFFGWEGVGLASYLLIGFWYKKPTACAAAIKAFVVNRVGDFGFALGIFAIFMVFGTLEFDAVFARVSEFEGQSFVFLGQEFDIITTICLLLFVGAMGKSAQLGLHTWLPDAMEGPTPVSALIHAATMVTAGVFMVARCSYLFEYSPLALDVVAIVGASTAFFAATIGLTQNDIKRVIAYSTCSQLGYMFFALGVSAYGAGVFHLFTHAFFKALLFLGAGSVIHAMSDEQDMRKMGGVWKMIPQTYVVMLIGTLALTGFPLLSGFFSKDMVIEAAYAAHTEVGQYAFWMGIVAAFFTAFYSWRLVFMTFHGAPRASASVMKHVHESPAVMTVPLFILALGAIFAGGVFAESFIGHHYADFWGSALFLRGDNVLEAAHHVPGWVKALPIVMGALGLLLAWLFYIRHPEIPGQIARSQAPLYNFLLNKWYVDELYDFLFVRPAKWVGYQLWQRGDLGIIDRYGPDGISATVVAAARKLRAVQTGYLYHYAFVMLIGVAGLATWFMVSGS
ncbi:MAG: NADH-quinone oxidoreductase subunit L [Kordiimonas sp.]|nr:NADH-quinone oxidoreductase subunit L [Kordiimonas sp.]|tara:strand:+ start:3730 stop:5655 length:1926 start_codon:yes stop_codon:yes gene_type:complete